MATRHLFSERELTALRGFGEPLRQDLIRFYTLSFSDLDFVAGRRGEANRLGAAVQLCTLRWLGFVPDDVASAPTVRASTSASQERGTFKFLQKPAPGGAIENRTIGGHEQRTRRGGTHSMCDGRRIRT